MMCAASWRGSINREADRLNRLVSGMLDMSRVEAGMLRPQLEWVSIGHIVADVLDRLEAVLKGRCVMVDVAETLPATPLDLKVWQAIPGTPLAMPEMGRDLYPPGSKYAGAPEFPSQPHG
jgi:signal transduction histidine kinase